MTSKISKMTEIYYESSNMIEILVVGAQFVTAPR